MKLKKIALGLTYAALVAASSTHVMAQPQILVTVDGINITASQLEKVLDSSSHAAQFTSMAIDDQTKLRGDLLRGIVTSQLLYLEAVDQKLDQLPAFNEEIENQHLGLLYRHYMDELRERIEVPPKILLAMQQQFPGDPDGLAAAKAAYRNDQDQALRLITLQSLREKREVKVYEERIRPDIEMDTVLLEGNDLKVLYGDIIKQDEHGSLPNPEWIKKQLYKRGELLLIGEAAAATGVDVSESLESYRAERLPAMLIEKMERSWIPDEKTLSDWYEANPQVGRLPERRHVGQLVVADKAEAEVLRKRIVAGESLFELAGKYSIDPYSRSRNGDVGWIQEGRSMPQLDQAIALLPDGETSEVIETPLGFHIITVLERLTGGRQDYGALRDKIPQMIIDEKMGPYLAELGKKYNIEWHLMVEVPNMAPPTGN